jgi:nitrate reductase gamma subunit
MYIEKSPSLFLPKLAILLLMAVVVSGMVEIVCLAVSAKQSNYSITNETSRLFSTPNHLDAPKAQLTNEIQVN